MVWQAQFLGFFSDISRIFSNLKKHCFSCGFALLFFSDFSRSFLGFLGYHIKVKGVCWLTILLQTIAFYFVFGEQLWPRLVWTSANIATDKHKKFPNHLGLPYGSRKVISKTRCSNHPLAIEKGRQKSQKLPGMNVFVHLVSNRSLKRRSIFY